MQKSLFTLFICCKILILSIFRANLKNDQKNDINVQFSHPLQAMYTNQSGCKETLYFFFICRNQIFHYQLSFWYIWKKVENFGVFLKKVTKKEMNFSTSYSKMNFYLEINLILKKRSLNLILWPKKRIICIFAILFDIFFSFFNLRQRMNSRFNHSPVEEKVYLA